MEGNPLNQHMDSVLVQPKHVLRVNIIPLIRDHLRKYDISLKTRKIEAEIMHLSDKHYERVMRGSGFENTAGCCILLFTDTGVAWTALINWKYRSLDLLMHEVSHLCYELTRQLARREGIRSIKKTEEIRATLQGRLSATAWKSLARKEYRIKAVKDL